MSTGNKHMKGKNAMKFWTLSPGGVNYEHKFMYKHRVALCDRAHLEGVGDGQAESCYTF